MALSKEERALMQPVEDFFDIIKKAESKEGRETGAAHQRYKSFDTFDPDFTKNGELRHEGLQEDFTWKVWHRGDAAFPTYVVWRLAHGTYSGWGPPCYTLQERKQLLEASETRKDLVRWTKPETDIEYTLTYQWFDWDPATPNDMYWGLSPGEAYFVVYRGDSALLKTTVKKDLREFWYQMHTGKNLPQRKRKPWVPKAVLPPSHRTSAGGPWVERLYLQTINESKYYPLLKDIYSRLVGDVIAGKTEDDFWEDFFPVVERHQLDCSERYCDFFEIPQYRRHRYYIPIAERRTAAWHIARRFRIECQINPQDFVLDCDSYSVFYRTLQQRAGKS